jgi:hypothetical protein
MQNSRACGEIAEVCLRSCVVNLIVIASGAKQSIFDSAMPSHGLLRSARNDDQRSAAIRCVGRESGGNSSRRSAPHSRCHRPRKRAIQYSRAVGHGIEKPQGTGYPAFAGYDSSRATVWPRCHRCYLARQVLPTPASGSLGRPSPLEWERQEKASFARLDRPLCYGFVR